MLLLTKCKRAENK